MLAKACRRTFPALISLCLLVTPLTAQEEDKDEGWRDSAELSFVQTSGNTDTSTLGFKNRTWRRWEKKALEFNVGGVRAKSSDARFASGTPTNFVVVEPSPKLTAENYWLDGKYYQRIRPSFYWQAGAGWTRDEFAGVKNRYVVFGGVGNVWADKEKLKWRTDYSLSYTKQEDVVDDPEFPDTYLGIRATSNFSLNFGKSSSYGNDTILDLNLDLTEDWRLDMTNWVTVTMTTHLALKVGLQWRYSNAPRLEGLDLKDATGTVVGTVDVPLEELDSLLTASLVVDF